ncbi:MAG: NUDIX domain-containing protein [Pseudomonadota bacterium]
MRRFGEPVRRGQSYRDRPGIYAVIMDRRGVLVTASTVPWFELQLPGGGIDPGEHPLAALHREVLEETGWRIRVQRRLGWFQRFAYMPEYRLWARKICTIYLAHPLYRLSAPIEAGHVPLWLAPALAAEALSVSGDRYFLQRAMQPPPRPNRSAATPR